MWSVGVHKLRNCALIILVVAAIFAVFWYCYSVEDISCFQSRYFVADNVLDEVTFGWPRQKGDLQVKEHLALRLQQAINWVSLLASVTNWILLAASFF